MQSVIDFTEWFIGAFPDFLMAEPICYFVGLAILAYIINIIISLRH